uniref:G domain-containing protein n=1 Tax=Panagrellus redivivus TaxID=6233 RepID=A0A7E4VSE7_PANRE
MKLKEWIRWFRSLFFRNNSEPCPVFTVLVIGASGVGKSTLLNFIHYMQHCSTFNAAVKTKIDLLLPVEVDANDKVTYMEKYTNNENVNTVGRSCTQKPMDHIVDYGRFKIHYVDTPGTNDTRGIDQDKLNVNLIVDHLAELPEVHAVLFVVKNDESKLGTTFESNLQLLLQMLPRKALKNCCFVYTFSAPMDFKHGRMSHTLKEFASNFNECHAIDDLQITVDNQYFVDNVAFKNLLTLQNGGQITNLDKSETVWDISKKNIDRFLRHACNIDPVFQKDFKIATVMQKLGKVMRNRGFFKGVELDIEKRRLMASVSDWAVTGEAILCQRLKDGANGLENDEWEQAAAEWKAKDGEIGKLVEEIAFLMTDN